MNSHKLSLKCFIENRWQQSIKFSLGFGLQLFEGVYFGLQVVQIGDDATLFGERRYTNRKKTYNGRINTFAC